MKVRSFVIVPQVPEALFFFSVYFLSIVQIISVILSSSSLTLLCFPYSDVKPIFILIIVIFTSKISICFSFISSISVLKLITLPFVSRGFVITC